MDCCFEVGNGEVHIEPCSALQHIASHECTISIDLIKLAQKRQQKEAVKVN
jgi:hypothetical protein